LEGHVYDIEEVEQSDPRDARHEVKPAENNSHQRVGIWWMKHILKHGQTDGEMNS
jgi:hypothetical protein